MSRTAKVIGFSVPPELKNEVESLARKKGISKSSLFRDMVKTYKQREIEREFISLQRSVSREAAKKGFYTEEDIERIVFEGR
jgi:metal-responsive CopG/Arc/MetJ family transcriptional regulator